MSKRVCRAAFVVGLILVFLYGKDSIASENVRARTHTGTKIVFASNSEGNLDLLTMRPDGTGRRQLTSGAANDREPDWSPDGLRVVFTSNRDGDFEIHSVKRDGTELRP